MTWWAPSASLPTSWARSGERSAPGPPPQPTPPHPEGSFVEHKGSSEHSAHRLLYAHRMLPCAACTPFVGSGNSSFACMAGMPRRLSRTAQHCVPLRLASRRCHPLLQRPARPFSVTGPTVVHAGACCTPFPVHHPHPSHGPCISSPLPLQLPAHPLCRRRPDRDGCRRLLHVHGLQLQHEAGAPGVVSRLLAATQLALALAACGFASPGELLLRGGGGAFSRGLKWRRLMCGSLPLGGGPRLCARAWRRPLPPPSPPTFARPPTRPFDAKPPCAPCAGGWRSARSCSRFGGQSR